MVYFKCNGGGRVSGYLLSSLTMVFFVLGPSVVVFVPRCMAGCILLHMGIGLVKEALFDAYKTFDRFEYGSVVLITVVMTMFGMTAALVVGMISAVTTFTLQATRYISPIRKQVTARSLRSSQWRPVEVHQVLFQLADKVVILQLQGHIFFGNATLLCTETQRLLADTNKAHRLDKYKISYLIVDFALVLHIDSSAIDSLLKLIEVCKTYDVNVCFCQGSGGEFPCKTPLRSSIEAIRDKQSKPEIFVARDLAQALRWSETGLLSAEHVRVKEFKQDGSRITASPKSLKEPMYKRQLFELLPTISNESIDRLLSHFAVEKVRKLDVLWRQGDIPQKAVLVKSGKLYSFLEKEEQETSEVVEVGFLVGEFGLLTDTLRFSTMIALEDSELLVLTKLTYEKLIQQEPYLVILLSKICMVSKVPTNTV